MKVAPTTGYGYLPTYDGVEERAARNRHVGDDHQHQFQIALHAARNTANATVQEGIRPYWALDQVDLELPIEREQALL